MVNGLIFLSRASSMQKRRKRFSLLIGHYLERPKKSLERTWASHSAVSSLNYYAKPNHRLRYILWAKTKLHFTLSQYNASY